MLSPASFLNGNTNGGFRRPMMKINNALHKRTSLTDNENREWGRLNNIEGIVADNINKVRGIRSNRLFWEEGGSFKNLETAWIKGEALVTVAGARKGIMSVWGTGGDSDASALEGLSKMFNSPKEYNVLPYKNNYSEDGEVQYTGYFIPAFNIMLKKVSMIIEELQIGKSKRTLWNWKKKEVWAKFIRLLCRILFHP